MTLGNVWRVVLYTKYGLKVLLRLKLSMAGLNTIVDEIKFTDHRNSLSQNLVLSSVFKPLASKFYTVPDCL
jgi:hypothetical protein